VTAEQDLIDGFKALRSAARYCEVADELVFSLNMEALEQITFAQDELAQSSAYIRAALGIADGAFEEWRAFGRSTKRVQS
jgi:hypothetical protein